MGRVLGFWSEQGRGEILRFLVIGGNIPTVCLQVVLKCGFAPCVHGSFWIAAVGGDLDVVFLQVIKNQLGGKIAAL